MPLEAIWPGANCDYSRTLPWSPNLSYTQFRRGDILVPKITPTFEAGRTIIAEIPSVVGLASTEVHVVRANEDTDPRFLQYTFQSQPFLDEGAHSLQGVGNLRRITPRFVHEYKVLDVARDDQARIGEYLDRETTEIEEIIGRLDDLASTLRHRESVVRTGVVCGLSASIMKTRRPVTRLCQAFLNTGGEPSSDTTSPRAPSGTAITRQGLSCLSPSTAVWS